MAEDPLQPIVSVPLNQYLEEFKDKIISGVSASIEPRLTGLETRMGNVEEQLRNKDRWRQHGQITGLQALYIIMAAAIGVGSILASVLH